MNIALLIPIYNPNDKVISFLKTFKKDDFSLFVVINDGSLTKYDEVFIRIKKETPFKVISYSPNMGKGYALKKGIEYISNFEDDIKGIVTCDSDGQHLYTDVIHIKEALSNSSGECLIMGVRDLSSDKTPKHNQLGNKISCLYYKLYTGKKIKDTQTGLRGIPQNLYKEALSTPGNRYDFEMNFLMDVSKSGFVDTIDIATIYDANSKQESHFNVITDSFRIYKTPILYVAVALLSALLDLVGFYIFNTFIFSSIDIVYCQLCSVIASRMISGTFNFFLNFFVVFPSPGGRGRKSLRYAILFIVNMGLSFAFTSLFSYLGEVIASAAVTLIKLGVDIFLAIANFFTNWLWVFAKKRMRSSGIKKDVNYDKIK